MARQAKNAKTFLGGYDAGSSRSAQSKAGTVSAN
jgi:hypothetical protein